ncbi:ShlB/FhaC/HecB family hemolysin secretion/activation protein [Viridibacterium curvum]|uniref:ShlB/FhaC/HecB family hemolysin secretion/activation protein n=1 Tax=Viridibacterium curvum TaxID=1101404 RepID=A0ABP9QL87_9RHOO
MSVTRLPLLLACLALCAPLAGQAQTAAPGATQAALPATFLITELLVEGNTVLSSAQIERVVERFLGPDRKLDDVYAAQDALAKVYEESGYVSATVRALRLDPIDTEWGKGWVAVLVVTEGRVDRLKVTGAQYNLPSAVRDRVASVGEGKVPHFPTLQKELAEVAGMSDLSVTPLLRPGRDPGTMEVELKVEDKLPLHAWAQLSNEQSPDTSPRRMELGARYDNLWQAQHSVSFRFINTPLKTSEIQVGVLTYSLPNGKGDERLTFYGVRSDSKVGTDTATGVVGKGSTLGFRQTAIVPASGEGHYERLSYGADYKRLGEESEASGSKPVQYLPLALQFIGMYPGESGRWRISSGLTASFAGVMDRKVNECSSVAGDRDQFDCRRAGASASFLVWNSSVQREHKLGKWGALQGKLGWQFASGPLISSEQFFVGGADSVRGYYQSEAGGDDGANASLEYLTPSLIPESWKFGLKFLTFFDAGWVRKQQVLSGQTADYRLIGTGLGVRLEVGKTLTGTLDWGRAQLPGPTSKDGANRVHAQVKAEF